MTGHDDLDSEEGFVDGGTGRDRLSTVVAATRATPHILRITVEGDLDDIIDNGGDQHITVNFYEEAAILPPVLTREVGHRLHKFVHLQMRRYTVRRFDGDRMDIDVVVHPDGGPGCRWAEQAQVGDVVRWWGPTEGWHPRSTTTTVIAVGDETALPAIEAVIREAPADIRIAVVVEVGDPGDRAYLDGVAHRADIVWVQRSSALGAGSPEFLEAIEEITARLGFSAGETKGLQVWGAAEYTTVQGFRRHFHGHLGLSRADAFLVTYWTHGQAQDLRYERRLAAEVKRNRAKYPDEARQFVRVP